MLIRSKHGAWLASLFKVSGIVHAWRHASQPRAPLCLAHAISRAGHAATYKTTSTCSDMSSDVNEQLASKRIRVCHASSAKWTRCTCTMPVMNLQSR